MPHNASTNYETSMYGPRFAQHCGQNIISVSCAPSKPLVAPTATRTIDGVWENNSLIHTSGEAKHNFQAFYALPQEPPTQVALNELRIQTKATTSNTTPSPV